MNDSETASQVASVVVGLATASLYVASWFMIGIGHPYGRARPLGLKLFKMGTTMSGGALPLVIVYGIVSGDALPPLLFWTTVAVALFVIPATGVFMLIDTRRGGPRACIDEAGDNS